MGNILLRLSQANNSVLLECKEKFKTMPKVPGQVIVTAQPNTTKILSMINAKIASNPTKSTTSRRANNRNITVSRTAGLASNKRLKSPSNRLNGPSFTSIPAQIQITNNNKKRSASNPLQPSSSYRDVTSNDGHSNHQNLLKETPKCDEDEMSHTSTKSKLTKTSAISDDNETIKTVQTMMTAFQQNITKQLDDQQKQFDLDKAEREQ